MAGQIEPNGCTVPPTGWWCSREAGHDGPCAARPANDRMSAWRQMNAALDTHGGDSAEYRAAWAAFEHCVLTDRG